MFDKSKFAQILKNISETYDNQRDFAKKSDINRTYLSQYMNMKLDEPPKPKILEKLAGASNGLVSYNELMQICGYINDDYYHILYGLRNDLNEIESFYLDELNNLKLQKNEENVYDDLIKILPISDYFNYNSSKIDNDLKSYFDNMDFLSDSSKNRIMKKTKLFINYCKEMKKMREKISIFEYNHKKNKEKSNQPLQYNILFNIPVYGKISAGQPNWAEECLNGYLPVDPNLMDIINPEECFFLRVNGESMNKVIRNGAYALIRKTDWVENGEIAVVLVNGFDATLKKFTKQGDVVVLEPISDDPTIETQVYDKNTSIKVLGKYIGKFEMN